MTVLKGVGMVLRNHIVIVLVALIFSVPFSYISDNLPTLYNAIVLAVYIIMIYSAGWNIGKLDSRKIPGYSPNVKRAVVIGLVSTSVTAVLFLFRVIAPYIFEPVYVANSANGSQMELVDSGGRILANLLYRIWLYPCVGFMPDGNFWAYLVMGLIIPVFVPVGYIVGLRRFSVLDKFYPRLVYKRKEKEEDKKNDADNTPKSVK